MGRYVVLPQPTVLSSEHDPVVRVERDSRRQLEIIQRLQEKEEDQGCNPRMRRVHLFEL